MSNLIVPKKRKIDEVEEVALPYVKCDSCGKMTNTGLHQKQLIMVKKARMIKVGGQVVRQPPVMKQVDAYMCTTCVKKGKKWPGKNPR